MAGTLFCGKKELGGYAGVVMKIADYGDTTSACIYIEDESSDQSLTPTTHVTPSFQYIPR